MIKGSFVSGQSDSKGLLEKLIFMGRNEDSIEIDDVKFTMSSLSEGQNRQLLEKLFVMPEVERISKTKSVAVAASLVKINEYSIDTVISEIDIEGDDLDKKIYLASTMQSSVVNKLYEFLKKLTLL